ncbi:YrhA family protein, partial [Escherichia sp. HC-CC]
FTAKRFLTEGSGIERLNNRNPLNSNSTNCLEKLCNEVSILFKNQPDYLTFLRAMDGFEVNGLRLFSLSIPEPSVKNLFAVNEFYRNNDDFI